MLEGGRRAAEIRARLRAVAHSPAAGRRCPVVRTAPVCVEVERLVRVGVLIIRGLCSVGSRPAASAFAVGFSCADRSNGRSIERMAYFYRASPTVGRFPGVSIERMFELLSRSSYGCSGSKAEIVRRAPVLTASRQSTEPDPGSTERHRTWRRDEHPPPVPLQVGSATRRTRSLRLPTRTP